MDPLTTYIVTDDQYLLHKTGRGHPEQPNRHTYVNNALSEKQLMTSANTLQPRFATDDELSLCHPIEYINLVREEASAAHKNGNTMLSTGDAQICDQSFTIATLAAGGVLTAVDAVMKNVAQRVFCNIRPPGHHACSAKGMGFCLFNNVAVGARYAQEKWGIERVLIVDWDVHHGNGTQEIFYDDPTVFYFSTHQSEHYPHTGFSDETGSKNAKNTTLNIPIPGGKGSRECVINAINYDLVEAAKKFKPTLIFISAGFDAHKKDPYGGFDFETEDFATLTETVCQLANKYCEGRVISVLEGGYNLQYMPQCAAIHVDTMNKTI